MKIIKKQEKWILSGWKPLIPNAYSSATAHWFFVNRQFPTKRAAMAEAKEFRSRCPEAKFLLRREQVQQYREF